MITSGPVTNMWLVPSTMMREVGDGGRVHRAAGARAHDGRDLRHDARGERVAQEHVGVGAERDARPPGCARRPSRSDPRPARRSPCARSMIAQIFLRVGLAHGAAEHGEVLREAVHHAAVHRAPAGHHAVAGDALLAHAEVGAAVRHERADLDERAGVEQQLEPLAGGQPALGVDLGDAFGAAAGERLLATAPQFGESLLVGSRASSDSGSRCGGERRDALRGGQAATSPRRAPGRPVR